MKTILTSKENANEEPTKEQDPRRKKKKQEQRSRTHKERRRSRNGGRRRRNNKEHEEEEEVAKAAQRSDSYGQITFLFYKQKMKGILVLSPWLLGVPAKTLGAQSNSHQNLV